MQKKRKAKKLCLTAMQKTATQKKTAMQANLQDKKIQCKKKNI